MAFVNPNDSAEVLYGTSGDVRNEVNAFAAASGAGRYLDESDIAGSLIIRSLERATRLVNGYLEVAYADQIPFGAAASVPKLLDDVASDIATYYTLRSSVAKVGPLSETKKQDYYLDHVDPKTGTLTKISERKLQLPELTSSYASDAASSQEEGRHAIFDVDDTASHEVDSDLLDDISDDRD